MDETVGSRWDGLLRPLLWLSATGLVVVSFDVVSSQVSIARRGIFANFPPVYAHFDPHVSPWALAAIGVAGLAALATWFVFHRSVKAVTLVCGAIVLFLLLALFIGLARGRAAHIISPLQRTQTLVDYQQDVSLVDQLGVRGFVEQYPTLIRTNVVGRDPQFRQANKLHSIHSLSHPPGNVLVMWLVSRTSRNLYVRALLLAVLSALVVVPVWLLGRLLFDQRTALIGVALIATAPGPLLYAFTSLDAVTSTILTAIIAAVVLALRRSAFACVIAGCATAFGFFFLFQTIFVVCFAVLFAFLTLPWKRALTALGWMALGGVIGLAMLWLTLGFSLPAALSTSLAALSFRTMRPYWYWLFGNYAAWLTFAGVPLAAAFLKALLRDRSQFALAFVVPLAVFYALPPSVSHVIPGETERVWQFVYPVAAVAAAPVLAGWSARATNLFVPTLVLVAGIQALWLQLLFATYW